MFPSVFSARQFFRNWEFCTVNILLVQKVRNCLLKDAFGEDRRGEGVGWGVPFPGCPDEDPGPSAGFA